jgi:S1-C subfamily serine protease
MVEQIGKQLGKDPHSLNVNFLNQYSQFQSFKLIHHVFIPDGSSFPFEIKQYGAPTGETQDQGKDVAIVKIEVKNAPILKLSDSEKVKLQDHVTVIGFREQPILSILVCSTASRHSKPLSTTENLSQEKQPRAGRQFFRLIQPQHTVTPGPVVNDASEVVGLLTFRGDTINGQEVSGFSFVVPSNTVMEYVRSAGAKMKTVPPTNSIEKGWSFTGPTLLGCNSKI